METSIRPTRQFADRIALGLFLILLCISSGVAAFDISGRKWTGGETDFYIELAGLSATGIAWEDAFKAAIGDWNEATAFKFNVIEEYRDPCVDDRTNGVDFTTDVCGSEYGENTLAVTLMTFTSQILGPPQLVEADIVVNLDVDFDVFAGNLLQFGQNFSGLDFQRVALHELGHALGLGHEMVNEAIMAPSIGNLDRLSSDDIAGVNTLYGGLQSCVIRPLRFGLTSNALSEGDCTVKQLTVGGEDTSFVDIYAFELEADSRVEFSMSGPSLDSVLVLADSELRFLGFDDKSSGECDSTLSQQLSAGSYLLLANTFDIPPKTECGNTGGYAIDARFTGSDRLQLGNSTSLLGGSSAATFSGGVSANGGLTWGNRFSPTDSLDISARILVDPLHVGQEGFLVVGAIIGEQVLLMNEQSQFQAVDIGNDPLVVAGQRTLGAQEDVIIASELVPADLGVDNIVVDFIVGYGLLAQPAEVYFHPLPINLTVSPL